MSIKLQYSKSSARFIVIFSEMLKINIEIFFISYIRAILKGQIKPFYNTSRMQAYLKRGSGRKKTVFHWHYITRFFNLLITKTKLCYVPKYLYRKFLKKKGLLKK